MRKRGRKFDVMRLGRRYEDVEIRFDSVNSTFFAEFIGKEFEDKDLNKVKQAIRDEAKSREETTWEPVILINFNPGFHQESLSGFYIKGKLLGTCKYPDGVTEQILAHYSAPMHSDKLDASIWKPIYPQDIWKGDTKYKRIIPYSAEKYVALESIQTKLREFKVRLLEIISGDECEGFIDSIIKSETRFLPLPMQVMDEDESKED